MFERFTGDSRQVVVQAQEAARELRHDYIGTEHILLGLLEVRGCVAGQVLRQMGLTREAAIADVESIIGQGQKESPKGHIPFTRRSKKILELALREALSLKHNYIGTEHILLAMIREGEGVAVQVMTLRLGNLDLVRKAVLAELAGATEERGGTTAVRRHKTTGAADEAVSAAEALAGGAPMGSHHLLEALVRAEGSMAAQVLASLGVDPEQVAAKIDELDPESTTDATPEEIAARKMELRLGDGEVQLVFRDADTLDLARQVTALTGGPIHGTGPVTGAFVPLWTSTNHVLNSFLQTLQAEPEGEGKDVFGKASLMMRRVMRARLRRRPPGEAV